MENIVINIHEDNLAIFNEKLVDLNAKFTKKNLPLINCSMEKTEMYHVDEWTKEKTSYTLYVATLSSDFNNTNLSGVDVEFEGVVSLIEKEESSKIYTFKNINYSSLLANCSCDKCHKKIGRNKYLVFSKVGKEVKTRDDLVVLGTSCAKDYFPFSVESYFGFLESAFEELGSYDEFNGSFGGCSSHYHTLSAIYTATLACSDNLKVYEKEGVTKGNVLGWLNNLKMDKYTYYRDVYLMPSNPIPFEDVISWVKNMYDTDEFVSDFHTNARSVFFKTLDDGTRELRNEIHEKYMGIAVYAMFASKQNHDKMVAKKVAEEKRAIENAKVEYYGAVGDKFELTLTFDKSFGFEGAYGFTYIHLFHDDENHVFAWSSSNGNYKVEYAKNVTWGGIEYVEYEVGHKYLIKGSIKDHREYRNVKQTVITRCKILDDFIERKVEVKENLKGEKCARIVDDAEVLDKLLDATSETEFEKIVQIA